MKNIDNIIFDLGNVILNIDYQNTIDAFEKIGVINASSFYSKSSQLNVFIQLETGIKRIKCVLCSVLRRHVY